MLLRRPYQILVIPASRTITKVKYGSVDALAKAVMAELDTEYVVPVPPLAIAPCGRKVLSHA